MKRTLSLFLVLAAVLVAGDYLNGIYLGEDVTAGEPRAIAVQIREDGTVIAFRGMTVPGLYDKHGRPVVVRRIEMR